jgi:hypothetical protein
VLASKRRRSDTLSPQLISQNNSSRLSYNRFRVLFLPSCPSHPLTRQQRVCGCGPARPHVAVRDHVQPVSAAVLLSIENAPLRACLAFTQLQTVTLWFIQLQTVTLCARYDIATSQMLVTAFDFSNADRRANLQVPAAAVLMEGGWGGGAVARCSFAHPHPSHCMVMARCKIVTHCAASDDAAAGPGRGAHHQRERRRQRQRRLPGC